VGHAIALVICMPIFTMDN